jgi:hypothetical protein
VVKERRRVKVWKVFATGGGFGCREGVGVMLLRLALKPLVKIFN